MMGSMMGLKLLVGGEGDELVGQTLRLLAQEVRGAEVKLELGVVAVELRVERGEDAVTQKALEVILPQMPPQPPVVVVSRHAELAERMSLEGAAMLLLSASSKQRQTLTWSPSRSCTLS